MAAIELLQDRAGLDASAFRRFYGNVEQEIQAGFLSPQEAAHLTAYYEEAGLLRSWRKPFFMRHYAEPFRRAALFLTSSDAQGRRTILDLGCGCGTQTLALALMGARVVGLDMDAVALEVLKKRRRFYEERLGRALDIEVHRDNTLTFRYQDLGGLDGVYSMFAFNMMQPSSELLDAIVPGMRPGARLVIQDGNQRSWLARAPGRARVALSPDELDAEFGRRQLARKSLKGAISLPPLAWTIAPEWALSPLDETLNRTWFWPISYLAMYEKVPAAHAA